MIICYGGAGRLMCLLGLFIQEWQNKKKKIRTVFYLSGDGKPQEPGWVVCSSSVFLEAEVYLSENLYMNLLPKELDRGLEHECWGLRDPVASPTVLQMRQMRPRGSIVNTLRLGLP